MGGASEDQNNAPASITRVFECPARKNEKNTVLAMSNLSPLFFFFSHSSSLLSFLAAAAGLWVFNSRQQSFPIRSDLRVDQGESVSKILSVTLVILSRQGLKLQWSKGISSVCARGKSLQLRRLWEHTVEANSVSLQLIYGVIQCVNSFVKMSHVSKPYQYFKKSTLG